MSNTMTKAEQTYFSSSQPAFPIGPYMFLVIHFFSQSGWKQAKKHQLLSALFK